MRSCQLTAYQVSFSVTKCNGKNSCFLPWAAMQAGSTFPKMGLERVLNCNISFVKLKCTFFTQPHVLSNPLDNAPGKKVIVITLKIPGIYLYVKFIFDHLSFLGKKLYSPTSGTPHLGFCISSYVSSSSLPVTSKPKKACISRSFAATVFPLFLIMPAGFGRRSQ